jgi:hypothetical protein
MANNKWGWLKSARDASLTVLTLGIAYLAMSYWDNNDPLEALSDEEVWEQIEELTEENERLRELYYSSELYKNRVAECCDCEADLYMKLECGEIEVMVEYVEDCVHYCYEVDSKDSSESKD